MDFPMQPVLMDLSNFSMQCQEEQQEEEQHQKNLSKM
jgi:hypothetical protein